VGCDQLRQVYGRADNRPAVLPLDGGPSDTAPRYEPYSRTLDGEKVRRWTEFHEAVARLPDDLRVVFDLLWYQGLPQAAAAAARQVLEALRGLPVLASVSDPATLASLPEPERQAWQALWQEVEELLREGTCP
jgi:hypothetical protein